MWEQCHHDYSTWDTGPNSHLMFQNSLFDFIRDPETVYLAHVTVSLEKIVEERALYPSAGCLVGSVYCVPAFAHGDDGTLRLHNLGSYYFLKEAPLALTATDVAQQPGRQPEIVLIEIKRGNFGYEIEGVNYLRMGQMHFDFFREKVALLDENEREMLQNKVIGGVRSQESFLLECVAEHMSGETSFERYFQFLQRASAAVSDIPYFGYVLFEAFSVTLMILQDDDFTADCRELKEFNNWNYKDLMYKMYPQFGNKFRLSEFQPNWGKITKLLDEAGLGNKERWFIRSVARRARKYICDNCFVDYRSFATHRGYLHEPISWSWASIHMTPLLGHLVHRELRNTTPDRHQELYRFFEQAKSNSIWNYWNKRGVALPFNGVIPKGEIGPNPCFTKSTISFYEGEVTEVRGRQVFVRKGRSLDLKIKKELGELRHTFRRDFSS